MSDDMGFLKENENGTDLSTIRELGDKCKILIESRKDIERAKFELSKLEEKERTLSREEIPNLLLQTGLTEIKLESGEKVMIQEKLACSLPKRDLEKRNNVLKFIIENGGGHIIKRNLIIEDPEQLILDFLNENKIPFENKKDIHSSTLRAWFSDKLGLKKNSLQELELQDIPKEANVFVYNETKIK